MSHVTRRDGESPEAMLSRFTRLVQRDGILKEVRRRRYFISNSEQARIDAKKAARRRARARRKRAVPR